MWHARVVWRARELVFRPCECAHVRPLSCLNKLVHHVGAIAPLLFKGEDGKTSPLCLRYRARRLHLTSTATADHGTPGQHAKRDGYALHRLQRHPSAAMLRLAQRMHEVESERRAGVMHTTVRTGMWAFEMPSGAELNDAQAGGRSAAGVYTPSLSPSVHDFPLQLFIILAAQRLLHGFLSSFLPLGQRHRHDLEALSRRSDAKTSSNRSIGDRSGTRPAEPGEADGRLPSDTTVARPTPGLPH